MHDGEVGVDAGLVRRLVAAQFPRWAGLPVEPVDSTGTVNAIYRLGDDHAVRVPRIVSGTRQIEKDDRWLPLLAPLLPLAVPVPVATGEPGEGYPWRWTVHRWLDGEPATVARVTDERAAAVTLAGFVVALRGIGARGGPEPGDHNFWRGVPLADRDDRVRECAAQCTSLLDADAALAVWDDALAAPAYGGPPTWIHGDLNPSNLLVRDGRLSAVIDFGGLGVGDPACDLLVAWTYLTTASREAFRTEASVDDAAWARGRGWAVSVGLIALPYYLTTNPRAAGAARRTIDAVLG